MEAAAESRVATFVFADLAGYTALTEAMGDVEAADLAQAFVAFARPLLEGHEAHVVKSIGDGLMLHVESAAVAIELGVLLASEIGGRHRFPAVRVGMHTGPAVQRAGDWFGAAVNLAARVGALAQPGEVLVTEATVAAAGPVEGVDFVDRGERRLRNVVAPVHVFGAVPCETCMPAPGLPIDPVCRMAVDPDRCHGTLVHRGARLHFCSQRCIDVFAADPALYDGDPA